jgi:hypothetical protein
MAGPAPTSVQADAMHALPVRRADVLERCPEGSIVPGTYALQRLQMLSPENKCGAAPRQLCVH